MKMLIPRERHESGKTQGKINSRPNLFIRKLPGKTKRIVHLRSAEKPGKTSFEGFGVNRSRRIHLSTRRNLPDIKLRVRLSFRHQSASSQVDNKQVNVMSLQNILVSLKFNFYFSVDFDINFNFPIFPGCSFVLSVRSCCPAS